LFLPKILLSLLIILRPTAAIIPLQAVQLGVGDNNGDGSLNAADVPVTPGDFGLQAKSGIGTTTPACKLILLRKF